MLKPQKVLHHMDEYDTAVFELNFLDKYVNCPDHRDFGQMCYAHFATNYICTKAPVKLDCNDIRNYTEPARTIDDYESDDHNVTKYQEISL